MSLLARAASMHHAGPNGVDTLSNGRNDAYTMYMKPWRVDFATFNIKGLKGKVKKGTQNELKVPVVSLTIEVTDSIFERTPFSAVSLSHIYNVRYEDIYIYSHGHNQGTVCGERLH